MRWSRLFLVPLFAASAVAAEKPWGTWAIPFEASGSTVLVPVTVNGSESRWFILDTGANSCALDHAVAEAVKLRPESTGEGTGAGAGPVPYRRYAQDSTLFAIRGIEFRCDHVISLDLSGQLQVLGREVGGILGSDFISQYVVEIDYDAQVLRLHDPATFKYPGVGDVLPLSFERRLPYVTATLTVTGQPPTDRRLLLDSGSEDAVDDELLLKSSGPLRETEGGVGLGQRYRVVFGWVERLQLGRFGLMRLPSVAPGVALIGGEVLRRFRVILDYSRRRLILEPGAHLGDAYRADRSGLRLRLAPDGGALAVDEVRPGSPSAAAGLKPGDRIISVDGVGASELGLRRVEQMFTAPGVRYRLRFQRGTEVTGADLETEGPD
jgi:aspartyl protease/PDZ domain-containing protein